MLQKKTVEPSTLSLLKKLQQLPELKSFYLVGGTALALWYGHRVSIDVDLFGKTLKRDEIIKALSIEFGDNFQYEQTNNKWAIFCYINNIKVDIVQYKHPLITPIEQIEELTLASTLDIAAMKINAILGRANKKDFWDIAELLEHYSLEEIIEAHQTKYKNQMLLISISQALTYFEEAEESENPICLKNLTWEDVKTKIRGVVSTYLS